MGWLSSSSLYVVFLIIQYSQVCFSSSPSLSPSSAPPGPQCHPDESSALLQLKSSFSIDMSPFTCFWYYNGSAYVKTTSWNESTNCCTWSGITCDKVTEHVIGLDLYCSRLQGTISSNSSLFLLRHLQRLDLSGNDFGGSPISSEFGQFKNLTHLDLSDSNFSGHVPLEISHLSKLVSFLLYVFNSEKIKIKEATFKAIAQNLTNLKELSLGGINLSFLPLVSLMNLSSSLTHLDLSFCDLRGNLPENIFRLPELQVLYLFGNKELTGSFPNSNWSSPLKELALSSTGFSIDLPHLLKNAKSLSDLYLSRCEFVGSYPTFLGNLSEIASLDLSRNNFSGQIPWSCFNLKRLRSLDLSFNNFIGQLPEVFANSSKNLSPYDSPIYLVDSFPSSLNSLRLSDNLLNGTYHPGYMRYLICMIWTLTITYLVGRSLSSRVIHYTVLCWVKTCCMAPFQDQYFII